MEKFLPKILATITRHPRFKQEWRWYSNSIVGNFFVLWHKVFWERCGPKGVGDYIKKSSVSSAYYLDGKLFEEHHFFQWETLFVHFEAKLFDFFKRPRFNFSFEFVPVMQLQGIGDVGQFPIFSFSIARDNNIDSGVLSSNSVSFSYTVNSSTNGLLLSFFFMNGIDATTPVTAMTYHLAAGSSLGMYNRAASPGNAFDIWYLLAPASGSNTFTGTSVGTTIRRALLVSYTGVSQVAPPDATGTGSPVVDTGSVASFSKTIAPVASNVWGIMGATAFSGLAYTAGANTSIVVSDTDGFNVLDTNAAETGSFTMNATFTAQHNALTYFSIAPVAAVTTTVTPIPFRTLLGVGG
jgi:hypothetical protein